VDLRLEKFYKGFSDLKKNGFDVDAIPPQAAIYLTVQFNLIGKKLPDGRILKTMPDVTEYLLEEAKLALVPFSAFGSSEDSTWYRLSVGTSRLEEIEIIMDHLREALAKLKD
jgi:aspartate aminotransferase